MSSLDPRMRVRDIIAEPLVAQGHAGRTASGWPSCSRRSACRAEAADRYPHQFSGGQRQRISIARALAPRPGDPASPTSRSAPSTCRCAPRSSTSSPTWSRELALTLVFVSHDLSVVRHVCDRVAVMHDGRIVETGATDEVYDEPPAPLHPAAGRGRAHAWPGPRRRQRPPTCWSGPTAREERPRDRAAGDGPVRTALPPGSARR